LVINQLNVQLKIIITNKNDIYIIHSWIALLKFCWGKFWI